ncbi:concanavalin A-like lectin/glucanase, partial [Lojkania enalia]
RYFRSRRARKEDIQQPWLDKKDPRDKWVTIIPLVGLILGLGLAGLLVWDGFRSVSNHQYCLLLDEDFSYWNGKVWMREVQAGGFGQFYRQGQFEMTTSSEDNVFLADNTLVIQPTLQDEAFIEYNNVIDLRGNGCVGEWYDCIATTNVTNGTIINPVNSGRINTKLGSSIKFGRVEVVAKLPVGDWLWPFIIMLPTESKYGPWPRSGQIDIMQSRGNDYKYEQGGNNVVSSTLHFGPNTINDGWWRNNVKRSASRTTFSNDYHTFGWSEKYIFTYIGTRLMQVMYTRFDQPFWKYGQFPLFEANGTALQDPWSWTEVNATPFDEDFYLVLGVSVGATNGWFKDGKSAKPWIDSSPTAKQSFWKAREDWYPTWRDQGYMQVKSVKMWQQGGYRGC